MESATFIEKVKKQFIDGEYIELFMDSEFRQTSSYDSLTGMTILVMLKDEYNVDITDNEYKSCKTLKDLYNLVISKPKS